MWCFWTCVFFFSTRKVSSNDHLTCWGEKKRFGIYVGRPKNAILQNKKKTWQYSWTTKDKRRKPSHFQHQAGLLDLFLPLSRGARRESNVGWGGRVSSVDKTFQPKASMKVDCRGRLVQGKEEEKQGVVVIATGMHGG